MKESRLTDQSAFLLSRFPVTFETTKPTTKPIIMVSGISMIWDMPTFQKNNRNVTTWVFWISMIRNKAIKTNTPINFGLIINPLSQYSPLSLLLFSPPLPFLFSL
jgi:competence transcription factor ComK